ncbi:uncharacterized protein ACA1_089300 [Acanthamoeba castellanii str. Neff]|uniref:Uncharacterized protein n=1 Tax=Acanthamoeba castellanii (strain ATCC 30010 / Neff) TaxID=1257118 RepID=L8GUT2_ACACF|nr:uncharacterized protein ACA1_089300 [Acanthamoeba castellanii str. Neff]ELR16682.1 hypothetical protein ACA1_089300 [Acanthamoeba castellanii str. Neff]
MEELVGRTASTELRPWAFLVAWDGVLTLAYRGFPCSLVDLKQHIGHHFPELPPENPGSKWPKTTLGALAEGSPPLTLDQLRTLKRVCDECSAELRLRGTPAMRVDQLAVVVYCCASLEKRLITHRIDLLHHTGDVAAADIGEEEMKKVDDVLAEFDENQLERYIERVATGRNHAPHYRNPRPLHLPAAMAHFCRRVDEALGKGCYEWFHSSALHVTVRGL